MDNDKVLAYCDQIDQLTQQIRDEVLAKPVLPEFTPVAAGEDLQACLTQGGLYQLAANATFVTANGYEMAVPQTGLRGELDNSLGADTGPALSIPPGMRTAVAERFAVAVNRYEVAIRVGRNDDRQTTLDVVPSGVRFRALRSTGHRGKRVFEINGSDVELIDCEVHDCFDPEGQDSQGIWIGNAPGPVRVEGGYIEAASENLLVGGDAMKIPNCRPTGIAVRYVTFSKPLTWKVEGGPPVKNILELKDGHDVLIEHCDLSVCWLSAQGGYCFMFTPTRGGSLRNVVVRDCNVRDVSGIVNITGIDAGGGTPRTQVSISGGSYRTNRAAMGGQGRFALVTRGPEWFRVENVTVQHESSAFIDFADKAPVDHFELVGSAWNYGSYGIRIGGYSHGDNQLGLIGAVRIEGNTISGSHAAFRARYPNNTYVGNMTRDAELLAEQGEDDERRRVDEELAQLASWLKD
jgi:hypothetical protein